MKRVKESRERIAVGRHEMSLMSIKHQQLVDKINQLEAAVEQKNNEYKWVSYLFSNDFLIYIYLPVT